MPLELVSIPTKTRPLDGLFYEPDGGARAGGVLLFHVSSWLMETLAPSPR
ncbi:MAG: hypothetical protein JWN13_739 [Betaproteobacteria bacterium]|jgi:hypothetical protein|nr:hypothetical protein [Betaproteobacteria bacterium]MEA3155775.1 hypothetical protein [Betaproteobacteria bacterium]